MAGGALCRAVRKDGHACRARAKASGYCFGHDPALRERHQRGRSAGGQGRSTAARARKAIPRDMVSTLDQLSEALDQLHGGELEPRIASAMAALANAIVRVYEVGELALRVKRLEQGSDRRSAESASVGDQGAVDGDVLKAES